jgi:4-amino-4-deoxy-L-arabinose transferase-like glycosyltransferase
MERMLGYDAGMNAGNLRVKFFALWSVLQLAKIGLAATLPLFVDEAFYAWEGRYLAWAYSDLPGLTAFLGWLGIGVGGMHAIALRGPFLLIGAVVPWLVVRIATRWFGEAAGWCAGLLALLMPLSGLLGVLALPDLPLVFAALLCLDAIACLRERFSWSASAALALALVIGALSHYRFALVVAAGFAGLLCDRRGRELFRDARFWLVIAIGLLAWLPLLSWNMAHGGAGLRFQLWERNPWTFHADAIAWIPIQLLVVTPVLFFLLLATLRRAWQWRDDEIGPPWGLIAGVAAVSVPGYFLLGFFSDEQRVSFHWPLAGWLVLVVAAPVIMSGWRRFWRLAVFVFAGAGLSAGLAFLLVASQPVLRSALADSRFYPKDFAGWQEISSTLARKNLPAESKIVASDFELGAELAFALGRKDIQVLDSPLNHKHGRAAQLAMWKLQFDDLAQAGGQPVLLVVDDSATPMKNRLLAYHRLCSVFGALPSAEVVSVDHGRKRYLIYRIDAGGKRSACSAPALAWIDAPSARGSVPARFIVQGWAFKEGEGLSRIEVTLDGTSIASAAYGLPMPHVAEYWKISNDLNHPRVGFRAVVDASDFSPGPHWLGLRLHGVDGSIESWPEQRIRIQP